MYAGCVKFSLPPSGWEFKQGMDINGNDVTNVPNTGGDWAKLIAGCDATPGCRCERMCSVLHADSITHNRRVCRLKQA